MSYTRSSVEIMMTKFAEWGLLTQENAFVMKNHNLDYILREVLYELINENSNIVLYQYDFNLITRHTDLVGVQSVLLELKQANVTVNIESLESILTLNSDRLNTLIVLLKHANMFNVTDQINLEAFFQSDSSYTATQLISFFTSPFYLFPEQTIDKKMYEGFFSKLELIIEQGNIKDNKNALDSLIAFYQTQGKHKIELLLLLDDNLDTDLISVIQMRQKVCQEKGNALIVMPEYVFKAIIDAGATVSGISKLSFLHHHAHSVEHLIDYREYIGKFTKQMPDLNEIVLRGCSTVEPDFDDYKLKMLKSHQDISSIQVQKNTLLISQKEEKGIINTYVKYKKQGVKDALTKKFTTIPLHNKIDNFSAKELEEIARCCGVTLESKPSSVKKDPELLKRFFSQEPMTHEEVQLVKQMFIRASTQNRNDFGNKPCLANSIMQVLIEAGYKGTLKGYLKGYKIVACRVSPTHDVDGINRFPKATRVAIGANEAEEKVHFSFEFVKNALMTLEQNVRYALFKPAVNPCRVMRRVNTVQYVPPQHVMTTNTQANDKSYSEDDKVALRHTQKRKSFV